MIGGGWAYDGRGVVGGDAELLAELVSEVARREGEHDDGDVVDLELLDLVVEHDEYLAHHGW